MSETQDILKRHIAAALLKIVCENLDLVNSYDKTNIKVIALGQNFFIFCFTDPPDPIFWKL